MSRKLIVLVICLLFIIIYIPAAGATYKPLSGTYKNCYIKSSGTIINRLAIGLFKIGNKALIIYLTLGYRDDGLTKIYASENGNLLWQEQGTHNMMLLFYRGNYSYTKNPDGSFFLAIEGLTIIVTI